MINTPKAMLKHTTLDMTLRNARTAGGNLAADCAIADPTEILEGRV